MSRGLRVVLASLTAIVMVSGGLPGVALADDPSGAGIVVAPDPAVGDVSPEMLTAMQRDLKVTAEQARARLVRADWAARLDPPLRQRLGRAFAGSWLADDGQQFVVAITDRRHEELVRASGATPKLVARSEADLSAIDARLAARATDVKNVPGEVAGWVTDPQANGVRVQHLPGGRAAAEAFVAAAGLDAGAVGFETVPARPTPIEDVEAGEAFFPTTGFQPDPNPARCSTGFAVTYRITPTISRRGYLTAAHCRGNRTHAYARNPVGFVPPYLRQGIFVASVVGAEHDEAVVLTDGIFRPVPTVTGHGKADLPVGGSEVQVDGSPVCTSGSTTLLQCGRIRIGTFNPPGGLATRNLKATDTCARPGDSGGAVISGTHAQGIMASSDLSTDGTCPFFGFQKNTYYIPVQRALGALGAALLTRVVPDPPTPPPNPSSRWAGNRFWDGLGGAVKGRVASVSLNPGQVQVFGRGSDDRLHTNISTDGVWAGWQGLGDVLTEPPTVLARAGGIDVYYRGADTRPYLRRWNGSGWEAPLKLGEIDVEGQIAAVSPGPGRVILFIRSSDDEVKYNFNDGAGWSGWLGLGGDVNAAPTAIARTNAAGQVVLEVYARWADDNVRYRRLDPAGPPGWQDWVNLGGIWKDTPVGVSVGPDHSFLVGWARDDTLQFQRFRNGDWLRGSGGAINTGWRGLGGSVAAQPTAIAGPGEQVRVYARDAAQRINTITWSGNDIFWENWTTLDGDTTQPVAVSPRTTVDQASLIDVFGIDAATQQPFHTEITAAPAVHVLANDTQFTVGDPVAFTVTGPPGAPIRWSSTKDGVPTGEDHAFYGHQLDSSGQFTWDAGAWPGSAAGSWVKQVHVGTQTQQTAQVAFTVSHRPVAVEVDRAAVEVGQNITYAVRGPANQPIRWSSSVNGQPSGESDAFYGQNTGPDGVVTLTVPWTDARPGTWTKQVSIGGQTAQVSFQITAPSPPPPLQARPMAAAASGDGRMYLFALGQDQRIWASEQATAGGAAWSDWYPLGTGVFSVPPTAAVNPQGRIEVYAVGTDHAVYRTAQTGSNSLLRDRFTLTLKTITEFA